MDNRVLNTITQYDSLILSMKLYYSHTIDLNRPLSKLYILVILADTQQ